MNFFLMRLMAQKNLFLSSRLELVTKKTTRSKLAAYFLNMSEVAKSENFEIPYNRNQLAIILVLIEVRCVTNSVNYGRKVFWISRKTVLLSTKLRNCLILQTTGSDKTTPRVIQHPSSNRT